MIPFWLTLLACYGLTFFLLESDLFDSPRGKLKQSNILFEKLFSCYFCAGFHASWFLFLLIYGFNFNLVLIGSFAGATSVYLLNTVIIRLESHDG